MSFLKRVLSGRHSTEAGAAPAQPAERGNAKTATDPDTVAGERGIASVNRVRSIQSRVSNVLAVGLMSVLGFGLLTWYYTQSFARQSRAQQAAQSASKNKAQGEMALPPLGRIDPPVVERVLGPPPEPPLEPSVPAEQASERVPARYAAPTSTYGGRSMKTPEDLAIERRLSGPVFANAVQGAASTGRPASASHIYERGAPGFGPGDLPTRGISPPGRSPFFDESGSAGDPGEREGGDAMAALLQPSATPAAHAKILPTQRLLLAKGSFVDCTLETAIDSTLPGMTTCVTATDTFSVDGSVVLLERGTKLVGETRGQVRQGTARVFVLWTEARTPTGVVVPLASPGTDELGRAGLAGTVDRHFWERFGAAILISVIDGAVQGAVQSGSDGGTVIVSSSSSRDIMTEVLRSTINIRPTVNKQNGDRIQVLVARDLDFRSVYELRPIAREL